MKLLLVSPYFPPQNAVASRRTHAFASCWASQGEHVTVLTTAKRENQRGLRLPVDNIDVMEVAYRGPAWLELLRERQRSNDGGPSNGRAPSRSGLMAGLKRLKERSGIYGSVRMPDLTDYWVKPAITRCTRESKTFDVVISSAGPYTAHLVAMQLKRRGVARNWVADFRDLWTDNHIFTGLFPFTLRERRLERHCLREADLIVTVTDGLAATLQRKCSKPIEVIYNGFDCDEAVIATNLPRAPQDVINLVYTGTTYPQGQDPLPLVRALRQLRDHQPHLAARIRITVAGKGCDYWRQVAASEQVEQSVHSVGIASRADALQLQRDAHGLILLDWKDSSQGVLTGKVFEYMNAAAPILVIGGDQNSPIARMISESGRGWHLGHDLARIEKALIAIAENRPEMRSQPNAPYIATFSRQHQSRRLLEILRTRFADSINRARA